MKVNRVVYYVLDLANLMLNLTILELDVEYIYLNLGQIVTSLNIKVVSWKVNLVYKMAHRQDLVEKFLVMVNIVLDGLKSIVWMVML